MDSLLDRLKAALDAEAARLDQLADLQTYPAAIHYLGNETDTKLDAVVVTPYGGHKKYVYLWLNTQEPPDWKWIAPEGAAEVFSQELVDQRKRHVAAHRELIELHEPEQRQVAWPRGAYVQCSYCASLCHSRSGLHCDEPGDAVYPCDTVKLIAKGYGIEEEL